VLPGPTFITCRPFRPTRRESARTLQPAERAAPRALGTSGSARTPLTHSNSRSIAISHGEWTDATVTRLRQLWAEGHSTGEIGRHLACLQERRRRQGAPPRSAGTAVADPRDRVSRNGRGARRCRRRSRCPTQRNALLTALTGRLRRRRSNRGRAQCRHLRARPPGALRQAYCQRARRTDGVHQNDAIAITAGRLSVAIECARPPELNQWERQFLGTRANWKGGRITQKQPDCLWRVSQRLGLRIRSRQTPPEQAAGLLNFEETPRRRPGGGRDQGGPG